MAANSHFSLQETSLRPGDEWSPCPVGWCFICVRQGLGYWMSPNAVKELSEGLVLLLPPATPGCLRASQLGEIKLAWFAVDPGQLAGILTMSECYFLASIAPRASSGGRVVPAAHPLAHEFAALMNQASQRNGLFLRCQMLQMVLNAFAEEWPVSLPIMVKGSSAEERFQQITQEMLAGDVLVHSVAELARRSGCSVRHFSRLFRLHFGMSIRSKQMELRLQKAKRLLIETDAKIINVALDSGYRHLSFFNAMFKKHFRMTPSQWRQQAKKEDLRPRGKTLRILAAVWGSIWLCAFTSPAQEPVASPSTNSPAQVSGRDTTNAPTFSVRGYTVEGNTVLPRATVDKAMAGFTGDAVSLDQIRQALASLQLAYRGRGFVTTAVSLPQQQLTNGLVKVRVVEGRLAEIRVIGNHYFSSNNVMGALPNLRTNQILNSHWFQSELDRANANRDRQIYPLIGPGPEPGTSALTLQVKDRLPLHGRFELNNQSTPATPDLRMNLALQYNNLWQQEHQVGVQYNFTPEVLKAENKLPGRFFDQPLIASYSAFYRMPFSLSDPAKANIAYQNSDWGYDEITRRFRPPPAFGRSELILYASRSAADTGIQYGPENVLTPKPFKTSLQDVGQDLTLNENLGMRLTQPLPSFLGIRSSLSVGPDFKSYQVDSFNTNLAIIELVTINNSIEETNRTTQVLASRHNSAAVNYLPFSLNWELSRPDNYGHTALSLSDSFYLGGMLDGSAAFQHAAYSTNASASFNVVNLGLTREQKLVGEWSLLLRASGQWASGALLNNEQFGLGGSTGVRGYRDGEEYGDTGWRVQIEPHTPLVEIGLVDGTAPMRLRGSVFTDVGERYLLEPAAGRSSSLGLWGTGMGITGTIGQSVDFRLVLAWALKDSPETKAGNGRVYFSVGAQF